MNGTLIKINETINNLEKSKVIISNIINKDLRDYYSIGEQVRKLRETLEFSTNEKKELISNTLLRIFLGQFGKMFVNFYEPFLNISIDSDEKKNAWLKLVEFLDDLDELDENNPLIKGMKNIDWDKVDGCKEKSKNNMLSLLAGDTAIKEKYKKDIITFIKFLNANEELKKKFSESLKNSKSMLNTIGIYENTFDVYLEILNEDYKKYREIGKEIKKEVSEEMINEFGLGLDEFLVNI